MREGMLRDLTPEERERFGVTTVHRITKGPLTDLITEHREMAEAAEGLAADWERRVSVLRGDGACGDVEADRLANVLQSHLDQLRTALVLPPEQKENRRK